MQNKFCQRINGTALETVMQETLQGMQEFTSEVCYGSETMAMEIIAVEKAEYCQPDSACVITFPASGEK